MVSVLSMFWRWCLSLRYRISVSGSEILDTADPILFLPNHIALVDPQILFTEILKKGVASPVVAEKYASISVLRPFFSLLKTIPVPDLTSGGKKDDVRNIFKNVHTALTEGRRVVLYPSGQLAGQGREALFGKQSAYLAVSSAPQNTRIIGVRIQGLWGSIWSKAWTGKSPPFFQTLLWGIFFVLANLIFFVPRREVSIVFEDITAGAKKSAKEDLLAFNQFLESFYNAQNEEPVQFLRHIFWFPEKARILPKQIVGSLNDMRSQKHAEPCRPETLKRIQRIVAKVRETDIKILSPETNLALDLGIDSLSLAELVAEIRAEFLGASVAPLRELKTVGDLCQMAEGEIFSEEILPECRFQPYITHPDNLSAFTGETLVECALSALLHKKEEGLLFDAISGTLAGKILLQRAFVVSEIIKKHVPEKRVGILLPASSGSAILFFASHLAGKTPVFFNWTVGKNALKHCHALSETKTILSSKSFFSLVEDGIPREMTEQMLFLEDVVSHLSLTQKISGIFRSLFPRHCIPKTSSDDSAVILFTSGSEALPKMVPLSHRNILSDIRGTLATLPVSENERLLVFLPPFHSFGLTAGIVLPLITGLPTIFTPNPTDPRAILRILRHTKATALLTTPTFLNMILRESGEKGLPELHLIITGAEACRPEIFRRLSEKAPNAMLVEGYGITECSPVVSINPDPKRKSGSVGVPIQGVSLQITDPENFSTLPNGTVGMILVSGDNVFSGYEPKSAVHPFIEKEGIRWYKTGDLGYLDADGFLFLTGRQRRFLKIGGEMASLPFLENILQNAFGNEEETTIAVEGRDDLPSPKIVLFATIDIPLDKANEALKKAGVSPLLRFSEVRNREKIPLLGSGKTDYKSLRAEIS